MAICSVCGTPLDRVDEPCPNCLPGMAWRPPTKVTFDEMDRLKRRIAELERQLEKGGS